MSSVIHPEVTQTLESADSRKNYLLDVMDQMRAHTVQRKSEDGDIAVRVNMNGELTDLWFKRGLMERKDPETVAREVTVLAAAASKDAVAAVHEMFTTAQNTTPDPVEARPDAEKV